MKKLVFLSSLFFVFGIFSCSTAKVEEEEVAEVAEVKERKTAVIASIPDFKFSIADLRINEHVDSLDLRAFKHFGEFYTEDFDVYRLDRIDFLAEAFYIDDINLFFIDDLLVKIQAFLREDKSDEFMRKYGKAKIAINDYHNRQLLENQDLLIRVKGKTQINKNLDNYTLKWDRNDLDISYSVNKKNDTTQVENPVRFKSLGEDNFRYKLTFQTKDFGNQMAWVKWESYKVARGLN